ncbi:winged helix-turn-helix transcriptional regulator [Actinokineospora enzanensis]|uniref:winged helix-turn-helix transcriptional regulator n=1 Tax=Actinokineospora enzanensis TaxID=155975 RepID=UPI0007C45EBD|nr:helix-turn-helix domain-containing protein [Actinokineospora enzanensis]
MGQHRRGTLRTETTDESSPIGHVLGTLSTRWGVAIVEAIDHGNTRFNELRRSVPGISHKVLIDALRSLQRDGFVLGPLSDPTRVEYRLSPLGHDLVDLIDRLRDWSEGHWHEISRANAAYDRGHATRRPGARPGLSIVD